MKEIDWEQRRWEAFVAISAALLTNEHDASPTLETAIDAALVSGRIMVAKYKLDIREFDKE